MRTNMSGVLTGSSMSGGADHHGYVPRVKGSMQVLGHDPDHLHVILNQMVALDPEWGPRNHVQAIRGICDPARGDR